MKTIKFITLLIFASFALFAFSNSAEAGALVNYDIIDNATGGDCNTAQPAGLGGVWDAATKTCVLTADVTDCHLNSGSETCITILSDDITLNCKGDMITATSNKIGNGVGITGLSDVKVKRCDIDKFDDGIDVLDSSNITLFYNNFTNNDSAVIRLDSTDNSHIIANNIDSTNNQAMRTSSTKNNYVIGNFIDGSSSGFQLISCTNDTFIANSVISILDSGFRINCTRSEFINNSVSNGVNFGGFSISSNSSRSTVFANISNGNVSNEGFDVASGVSGFKFEHNIADGNALFGIDDDSTGKKTAGTANTYEGNTCDGNTTASFPVGLCTGTNP